MENYNCIDQSSAAIVGLVHFPSKSTETFENPRAHSHQEQFSLQLPPVLGAAAVLSGLQHLPAEQSADTGPLLQENLHQGDLLRLGQQQR